MQTLQLLNRHGGPNSPRQSASGTRQNPWQNWRAYVRTSGYARLVTQSRKRKAEMLSGMRVDKGEVSRTIATKQGNAQLRVDAWRPNRLPFSHDPTYAELAPDARGLVRGQWSCKNCTQTNVSVSQLLATVCKSLEACKAVSAYVDRRDKSRTKLPTHRLALTESWGATKAVEAEAKKVNMLRRHAAYRERRKARILALRK